jgi:hypothetical protein
MLLGVADGARTHDNRNHNPGLYQLSYSHRNLNYNGLLRRKYARLAYRFTELSAADCAASKSRAGFATFISVLNFSFKTL